MSSKQTSPLLRTWYRWKALRLPWRKRFLVGLDLQGNTYWEFRDVRNGDTSNDPNARWRRIVQYPRSTHFDTVKVPPQWHQWLRHLRQHPPTLQEQHAEVRRQQQIKYLAAEADARWEAKPRVMMDTFPGAGATVQTLPVVGSSSSKVHSQSGGLTEEVEPASGETRTDAIASGEEQQQQQQQQQRPGERRVEKIEKENPWKKHRPSGPGEQWQPQAWTPPARSK